MLLSLKDVDNVIIFDEDEPKELIKSIRPNVLVKGADWSHYVSGGDEVLANGGKVVLLDLEQGKSTTNIIEKIYKMKNYLGLTKEEYIDKILKITREDEVYKRLDDVDKKLLEQLLINTAEEIYK